MVENARVRREFVLLSALGLGVHGVAWTIVFLTWLYPLGMSHWLTSNLGGMIASPGMTIIAVLDLLLIALGILGVFLIGSPRSESIKAGGIFLMIAALLSAPTAWGFIVGSALLFLAGAGALGELAGRHLLH